LLGGGGDIGISVAIYFKDFSAVFVQKIRPQGKNVQSFEVKAGFIVFCI
jgi:hypothetical protein